MSRGHAPTPNLWKDGKVLCKIKMGMIFSFRCSSAVEQLPVKEWVTGSNPVAGAK